MGLIDHLIFDNVKSSLAVKTWDGYSAAWRDWCSFCNDCHFTPFQADTNVALGYVAVLMSKNLSHSHISKTLAGIAFFLKANNIVPVHNCFLIKQALKGYRKQFPKKDSRRPITLNILEDLMIILPDVCSSSYEVALFRCAFSLAFFAALRINEFVSSSRKVPSNLKTSDIILSLNSLKIYIYKSKTDQFCKGTWITLNAMPNYSFCPVKLMSLYLSVRPHLFGSLFIHEDKSCLSKFQFSAVLKKSLIALKLDKFKLTSHSFRIGAATEAARLGLNKDIIQRIGRWESNRFQLYVRPELIIS